MGYEVDWTWFSRLPVAIQCCAPFLFTVVTVMLVWGAHTLYQCVEDRMTKYIFFNTLAAVGTTVGAILFGYFQASGYHDYPIGYAGIAILGLSLTGLVLYNLVLWIKWANNW
jgi:hypothetical protein